MYLGNKLLPTNLGINFWRKRYSSYDDSPAISISKIQAFTNLRNLISKAESSQTKAQAWLATHGHNLLYHDKQQKRMLLYIWDHRFSHNRHPLPVMQRQREGETERERGVKGERGGREMQT